MPIRTFKNERKKKSNEWLTYMVGQPKKMCVEIKDKKDE